MLVLVRQVKQLSVQSVQTDATETYPVGQVDWQVWSGLSEKELMQERQ